MLDVLHKEEGTRIEINLFGELEGERVSLEEGVNMVEEATVTWFEKCKVV
jgi:hypothetical protein